ncbi:MAG: ribose-phosphate pyrophosphokinase [Christensenellales bacterium]|jgi:ribose-phosphate pyrophosphokinase
MARHGNRIKLFTGNSNPLLANEIAQLLGQTMGQAKVSKFADGEISVNIIDSVRGSDVFVIQSLCTPVNDNLMELLIMIDAFKRASAASITAVIPYYGYARQDRKVQPRDPIAAKLVADVITVAGADRILTIDLHATQIQGFFNIPVDHLRGVPVLAAHYLERRFEGDDLVVVSPDIGSVTRARSMAKKMDAPLAIVDKRRPKANVSEVLNIIGDIRNKRCVLVDDLVDTAGTICNAAAALMEKGAREIYVCTTHGVLSNPGVERIMASDIKEIVILNTIPLKPQHQLPKIRMLSVAPVFAKAISLIYEDRPVSTLFE